VSTRATALLSMVCGCGCVFVCVCVCMGVCVHGVDMSNGIAINGLRVCVRAWVCACACVCARCLYCNSIAIKGVCVGSRERRREIQRERARECVHVQGVDKRNGIAVNGERERERTHAHASLRVQGVGKRM